MSAKVDLNHHQNKSGNWERDTKEKTCWRFRGTDQLHFFEPNKHFNRNNLKVNEIF